MADPTARFIIDGDDQSGHAFASVSKNFKELERGVHGVRRAFDLFGVALSVNAFSSWIKGAIEAKDLTEDQAKELGDAKEAFKGMGEASDELARSLAADLAPAMTQVSHVLTGLNALLNPNASFAMEGQVQKVKDKLRELQQQYATAPSQAPQMYFDALKKEIKETELELDKLKQTQLEVLTGGNKPKGTLKDLVGFDVDDIKGLKAEAAKSFPKFVDEHIADQLQPIEVEIIPHMLPFPDGQLDPIRKDLKDLERDIGRGLHDSIVQGLVTGEFAFKDFLKRMAAELFTSALFRGLAGMFTGGAGTWGSFFSGLFGGAKAGGGPVSSGRAYLVGERGPELFMPGSSGTIVPNGGGGGLVYSPNYNIDARGASPGVEAGLRAMLDQNNKRQKAEIADLIRRNRFAK